LDPVTSHLGRGTLNQLQEVSMKLYTNLFSPNARKVHAVANELGIELETHTSLASS